MADSIFYEVHVKGFTERHPEVPESLRGSYAGLAHPAAISHLQRLGVTAVELLPVHTFVHDQQLVARGLRNYWGYQSIGYFAPHSEYASTGDGGGQVNEFRQMVRRAARGRARGAAGRGLQSHPRGRANGGRRCAGAGSTTGYYRLPHERSHSYDNGAVAATRWTSAIRGCFGW